MQPWRHDPVWRHTLGPFLCYMLLSWWSSALPTRQLQPGNNQKLSCRNAGCKTVASYQAFLKATTEIMSIPMFLILLLLLLFVCFEFAIMIVVAKYRSTPVTSYGMVRRCGNQHCWTCKPRSWSSTKLDNCSNEYSALTSVIFWAWALLLLYVTKSKKRKHNHYKAISADCPHSSNKIQLETKSSASVKTHRDATRSLIHVSCYSTFVPRKDQSAANKRFKGFTTRNATLVVFTILDV